MKEKFASGVICTPYVMTNQQLADVLTKVLNKSHHEDCLSNLGMRDIEALA